MVGIKKVITLREDSTVVPRLQKEGYDKIVLYYSPHPRHKKSGLLPEQMLVFAWKYKARPDRANKQIGQPKQL